MNFIPADQHLYGALSGDLSSRYCPIYATLFLHRLWALFAAFAVLALALFALARFVARSAARKDLAYIGACAVTVFAIGGAALVLVALSGCDGYYQAGLTWDWPW
jgi:hypothetical protein